MTRPPSGVCASSLTLTGIAARPLAARTVGQRPRVVPTVTRRLHDVAHRAARTGNNHEVALRINRTFAVEPHHFAITFATRDAVVATVPEGFRFGTDCCHEAAGDQFAIRFGPAHTEVVSTEIFLRRERLRFHAVAAVLIHVCARVVSPKPHEPL